jgi:imidazolonepropionase-like amidohydrolase
MKRAAVLAVLCSVPAAAQIAVRGETIYTMAGAPIQNGVVLIAEGKIARVGPAASTPVPAGYRVVTGKVVTPGLIDAHTVVGLSGYLNQTHDQDQLERSAAIQPELRAVDAYDPRERLVEYLRGYGITTIHTGHGPGALISGQTMIVKTAGRTVDEAMVKPAAMVAATLGTGGRAEQGKSPGTRSKMAAMLRAELIKAREYAAKSETAEPGKEPAPDLRLDVLARVLNGELPLLVTVHRMHDVMTAIRLGKEFNLKLVLDGVADAHGLVDEIKASGYPVILHPTMARAFGDTENLSLETASKLRAAGIPFALQSGYESYVPKTRVVLFEAGLAAANGLSFEQALASITIDAARLLGIADRAGSLEAGKDADVAVYDGDPFEYTTHCIAVVLNGGVVSETAQ